MRSKKSPLPFNLSDLADAETIDYNNDTSLKDVASNKGAIIAAKKISENMRKYAEIQKKRGTVKRGG